MTESDFIKQARQLVQIGWVKKVGVEEGAGEKPTKHCVLGALERVAVNLRRNGMPYEEAMGLKDRAARCVRDQVVKDWRHRLPIYMAGRAVASFNDHPDTKHGDVLKMLDDAAQGK